MNTLQFEAAISAVANINAGINTGNSLEAHGHYTGDDISGFETQWGEPPLTTELFEAMAAEGFNAVRIPVTWKHHFDEQGIIDPKWLAHVEWAVSEVLSLGLYCIINIHHDGGEGSWIISSTEGFRQKGWLFRKLWEQIAEHFKDYGEKLLFEAVNEPINVERVWTANDPDSIEGTLLFNQCFVDVVRASGGNNAQRNLIVMPYAGAWSAGRLESFIMPKDPAQGHMIFEIHSYDPEGFCWYKAPWTTVRDGWGTADDYAQLNYLTLQLSGFMHKWNVPAIVGEFGSQDKQNEPARAMQAGAFVSAMREIGVKCFWWECGAFCVFNRRECTVKFPEIVKALVGEVNSEQ